jgi:hypothetical protein
MTENRLELVGLSVLVLTLTTTVSLAQNTGNSLVSGNTVDPAMSGNTVAQRPEAPVSPMLPTNALNLSTGTNAFTSLALLGATNNRRHHDVGNRSRIPGRLWTSVSSMLM